MNWKKIFLKADGALGGKKNVPLDHGRMRTNYLVVLVHTTLEHLGIFNFIRKKGGAASLEDIARQLRVRTDLLETCVNFLWETTDYIERADNIIKIKRGAPTWFWVAAYKPVFDNLEVLLRGTKMYGADIARDGYYLQKLSVTAGIPVENYIIDKLKNIETKITFIDLGCGPGTLLQKVASQNSSTECIGIDIDPIITNIAIKNARQYPQIKIVTADVFNIDSWRHCVPQNTRLVFSANTILHECLRSGAENLVVFLKKFKKMFPMSRFFVAEVDAPTPDKIKNEKRENYKFFMAMYMLIHPLSGQGLPRSQKEWLSFFEKGGWSVIKAEKSSEHDTRIIYDCTL